MEHAQATDELRISGLKATLPRMKVLDIFQRAGQHRHLSAEDVYHQLMEDDAAVGLPTVYRVLAQLERAGLLRRGPIDGARALFELDGDDHHDHLVCVRCGRIQAFADVEIEQRQRELARERGFELVGHAMALFGACGAPGCRPS